MIHTGLRVALILVLMCFAVVSNGRSCGTMTQDQKDQLLPFCKDDVNWDVFFHSDGSPDVSDATASSQYDSAVAALGTPSEACKVALRFMLCSKEVPWCAQCTGDTCTSKTPCQSACNQVEWECDNPIRDVTSAWGWNAIDSCAYTTSGFCAASSICAGGCFDSQGRLHDGALEDTDATCAIPADPVKADHLGLCSDSVPYPVITDGQKRWFANDPVTIVSDNIAATRQALPDVDESCTSELTSFACRMQTQYCRSCDLSIPSCCLNKPCRRACKHVETTCGYTIQQLTTPWSLFEQIDSCDNTDIFCDGSDCPSFFGPGGCIDTDGTLIDQGGGGGGGGGGSSEPTLFIVLGVGGALAIGIIVSIVIYKRQHPSRAVGSDPYLRMGPRAL